MGSSIAVKHNIEVAHRLFELSGKCEQIHGHSMWVTMELHGHINDTGILAGIEYGDLKKLFRGHLDETYDHRLLLNASDPFARPIFYFEKPTDTPHMDLIMGAEQTFLPGLQATLGDPTTENIAKWICEEMRERVVLIADPDNLIFIQVQVWETSVNMASHGKAFR